MLKLNVWADIKEGKNEYAFRYFMSKHLIDTLETVSVKGIG
jgi:hypothetical protein